MIEHDTPRKTWAIVLALLTPLGCEKPEVQEAPAASPRPAQSVSGPWAPTPVADGLRTWMEADGDTSELRLGQPMRFAVGVTNHGHESQWIDAGHELWPTLNLIAPGGERLSWTDRLIPSTGRRMLTRTEIRPGESRELGTVDLTIGFALVEQGRYQVSTTGWTGRGPFGAAFGPPAGEAYDEVPASDALTFEVRGGEPKAIDLWMDRLAGLGGWHLYRAFSGPQTADRITLHRRVEGNLTLSVSLPAPGSAPRRAGDCAYPLSWSLRDSRVRLEPRDDSKLRSRLGAQIEAEIIPELCAEITRRLGAPPR